MTDDILGQFHEENVRPGGYSPGHGTAEPQKHDNILVISDKICVHNDSICCLFELFNCLA